MPGLVGGRTARAEADIIVSNGAVIPSTSFVFKAVILATIPAVNWSRGGGGWLRRLILGRQLDLNRRGKRRGRLVCGVLNPIVWRKRPPHHARVVTKDGVILQPLPLLLVPHRLAKVHQVILIEVL